MNDKKRKSSQRKKALLKKNSVKYRQYKNRFYVKAGICSFAVLTVIVGVSAAGIRISGYFKEQKQLQEEADREKALEVEEKDITIGATGCMLLHGPIVRSGWYTQDMEKFDFSDIYKYVTPYYSAPDYMTCEFEGTLMGEDYAGYPCFHSPDEIIQNIADSGVDLQLIATNHMYDGLSDAFHRTMEVYGKKNLAFTGARRNTDEKPYYIADIDGVQVGFINYVYETEGGDVELNSIPIEKKDQDLINTFDYDELDLFYNEMEENVNSMKEDGARYIIANMHWGDEYQLKEADYQDKMAQKLCDMGVDALIGGHPHCEQPIDLLESIDGHQMFCIYSVGNALSNQRKELISDMPEGHTEDGVIVELSLHRTIKNQVSLTAVNLIPTWVYCEDTDIGNKYYILPLADVENLEKNTGISGIRDEAQASYDRTMKEYEAGLNKIKQNLKKEETIEVQ